MEEYYSAFLSFADPDAPGLTDSQLKMFMAQCGLDMTAEEREELGEESGVDGYVLWEQIAPLVVPLSGESEAGESEDFVGEAAALLADVAGEWPEEGDGEEGGEGEGEGEGSDTAPDTPSEDSIRKHFSRLLASARHEMGEGEYGAMAVRAREEMEAAVSAVREGREGRAQEILAAAKAKAREAKLRARVESAMAGMTERAREHMTPEKLAEIRAGVEGALLGVSGGEGAQRAKEALRVAQRRMAEGMAESMGRARVEARVRDMVAKARARFGEGDRLAAFERAARAQLASRVDQDALRARAKEAMSGAKEKGARLLGVAKGKLAAMQSGERAEKAKPAVTVVKDVMLDNVATLRMEVMNMIQAEMIEITKSVHTILRSKEEPLSKDESLHYVVASLIAPFRLKLMHWHSSAFLAHSLLTLVLVATCLALDYGGHCNTNMGWLSLDVFFLVFGGVNAVLCLARGWLFWQLASFWRQYSFDSMVGSNREGGGGEEPWMNVGKGIEGRSAIEEIMDDMTEMGEEAVALKYSLDSSVKSKTISFLKPCLLVWRCIGTQLWFDLQCADCDQYYLEILLTLTTFEFLVFLTYHGVATMLWFYSIYLNTQEHSGIIQKAKAIDKANFGFPLVETVVEQFVLRDSKHIKMILKRRLDHQIQLLHREKQTIERELKLLEKQIRQTGFQLRRLESRPNTREGGGGGPGRWGSFSSRNSDGNKTTAQAKAAAQTAPAPQTTAQSGGRSRVDMRSRGSGGSDSTANAML